MCVSATPPSQRFILATRQDLLANTSLTVKRLVFWKAPQTKMAQSCLPSGKILTLGQVCNFAPLSSQNASLFAFADFVSAADDEMRSVTPHYFEQRENASISMTWTS